MLSLNQCQYTVINHTKHKIGGIQCDAPEGFHSGPQLVFLCMSDIVYLSSTHEIILCADDTNVFFHRSSIDLLKRKTNVWPENLTT